MTQPDTSIAITHEQLTQLAYKAAGAALAYAGCAPDDLPSCMEELEPVVDGFVIDLVLVAEAAPSFGSLVVGTAELQRDTAKALRLAVSVLLGPDPALRAEAIGVLEALAGEIEDSTSRLEELRS